MCEVTLQLLCTIITYYYFRNIPIDHESVNVDFLKINRFIFQIHYKDCLIIVVNNCNNLFIVTFVAQISHSSFVSTKVQVFYQQIFQNILLHATTT